MAEHDFNRSSRLAPDHGPRRRSIVLGGGLAAGMALSAAAAAAVPGGRTDADPRSSTAK